MSDDLVKRLRAGTGGGKPWMDLHEEAADRIEELEAKLAKAVEALEWVKFGGGPTGESYHLNAVDTLAELTGGKDE